MTDDELEDRVEALEDDVANRAMQSESRMAFRLLAESLGHTVSEDADMVQLAKRIADDIAELQATVAEAQQQLDAIQDLGTEKTTKEEKVAALVQYAQNTATNPTADRIVVKAREIKGVAGVSRRYAYDLIEDLADEYDWIHDRNEVTQYGDLEISKDSQTRGIVVDLEQLHKDQGAVNKFTTATSREEASA